MDLADDVAYSVHDVEDGVVAGRVDLTPLDRPARSGTTVRDWYLPGADDDALDAALAGLRGGRAAGRSAPYDGRRRSLAALKNLTSDLIGRFCGSVQQATFAAGDGPFVRYRGRPGGPRARPGWRSAVLKGIAAHYVMQADDRVALMQRQRELRRRAGRGAVRARAPTPSTGRSPTTGSAPATTPPGCGSSSTRSRR